MSTKQCYGSSFSRAVAIVAHRHLSVGQWILVAISLIVVTSGCKDSIGPDNVDGPTVDGILVEVQPPNLSLGEGHVENLKAIVQDLEGEPLTFAPVSWRSTDTTVATVLSDGTVHGLRQGSTKIVARSGNSEGEAALEVRAPLSSVSVATPPGPFFVGERVQLEITLVTSDGDTVSSPHVRIEWSSSDTAVARVEADGWVTGIASGSTKIAATSEGATGHQDIEVWSNENGAWQVTVQPASSVLYGAGDSAQLTAELVDGDGTRVQNANFNWSSLDTTVASVTNTGKVTSLAVGTALIIAAANGTADTASVDVREKPPSPPAGQLPAFPGAKGWGATALDRCRDLPLAVHMVTNTNDSGVGSLRNILENHVRGDHFDIVIFRTGGLIGLNNHIQESSLHCLYIAGQTAPGGGISIVNRRLEFRSSDDVVIRHIRHRGKTGSPLRTRGGSRVIYDHVTVSWSDGPRFLLHLIGQKRPGGPLEDATVQNSLLYEPGDAHPTVLGLAGHPKNDPLSSRISVHQNVFMGPGHRLPMCGALDVSIINNVVYNWSGRASEANNTTSCDYIANYHKPGPATFSGSKRFGMRPFVFTDACDDGPGEDCSYSYYVAANRNLQNQYQSNPNPWEGPTREVTCRKATGLWCGTDNDPVPPEHRRFSPLPDARIPVTLRPITNSLVDGILAEAGHSKRLTCDGSWISVRDQADSDRIAWFYAGTGPGAPVNPRAINVPVPAPGTPCQDTDGDGIPDKYEQRYSGSPTGLRADEVTESGYLVFELYLAGNSPDWRP